MSPLIFLLACAGGPPASSDVTFTEDSVLAPALARLDTDADGKVNAEEYARVAFKGPTFAQVDVDSDGAISLAELRTIVLEQDPEKYYSERKHPMRGVKDGRSAAAGMPGTGTAGGGEGGAGAGEQGPGGGPEGGGAGMGGPGMGGPGAGGPGMGGPGAGGPGAGGPGAGGPGMGGPGAGGPGMGGPGKGGRGPGKGGPGIGGKGHREPTLPPPSLLVIQILCEELLAADPSATVCVDTEVLRIGEGGSLQTAEAQAFLAKLEAASDAAKLGFPTTLRAANAPPPAAPPAAAPTEGAPAPKIAEP